MKKLITAAALAAFALATTTAMAEDTKSSDPTKKTGVQHQMDTQSTSGAKMAPSATTGSSANTTVNPANPNVKSGDSTLPGKPTDSARTSITGGK
jgi:Flp pilus assembly protein TadG